MIQIMQEQLPYDKLYTKDVCEISCMPILTITIWAHNYCY